MSNPNQLRPPQTPTRTPSRRPRRSSRATPSSRMFSSPGTRSPTRRLVSSFNALSIGVDTTAHADNLVIFEFTAKRAKAGFPYYPEPVCDISVNDPRIGVDQDWDLLWQFDQNVDTERVTTHLEFLLRFLFDQLLVNVKSQRCIVIQPTFLPNTLKKCIADVVLTRFRANSLQFVSSAVCNVVASGTRNALVVDIDWNETTVTPVYDLREMTPQARSTIGWSKCQNDDDFFTSDYNDDDEMALDELIDSIVCRMDIDTRAAMANVIVVGATPGVIERLSNSRRPIESLGAWVGAGLYISSIGWYLVQEERARLPGEMSKERYQSGERWLTES